MYLDAYALCEANSVSSKVLVWHTSHLALQMGRKLLYEDRSKSSFLRLYYLELIDMTKN